MFVNVGFESMYFTYLFATSLFLGMMEGSLIGIFFKNDLKKIVFITMNVQLFGLLVIMHPNQNVKLLGAFILGVGISGFYYYSRIML